jgi:parallel beta-helix repeat protein
VGTSGVSWHLSNEDRGTLLVTGEVVGSRFHHNFDGLYISGGVGLHIADNEVSDSVRYGIDLYDATHDCIVENNRVHRSGRHGIIASQGSVTNDIRQNEVHDNAEHGIIIHEGSHGNRLQKNMVYQQRDGVVLHRSQNTVVTNNTVYNSDRGIRLTGASHNLVADNEVRDSDRYGIYVGEASDINSVRGNVVTNNPVGIYVLSKSNEVTANTMRHSRYGIALHGSSEDNRLTDNTIEFASAVGLYVKTTLNNFADHNIFRENRINIR